VNAGSLERILRAAERDVRLGVRKPVARPAAQVRAAHPTGSSTGTTTTKARPEPLPAENSIWFWRGIGQLAPGLDGNDSMP